jgi:hypothetical protein
MIWRLSIILLGLGILSSCSQAPQADCASPTSTAMTADLVKQNLQKLIKKGLSDAGVFVDNSQVDAYVGKLKISVQDIRTTKKDPNSSKKFCAGSLRVSFPDEMIQDADSARQMLGFGSTADFVRGSNDLAFEANTLKGDIAYAVQPTDDGKKVFSELDFGQIPAAVSARVISDAMLKPALDKEQERKRLAAQEQEARKERERQDAEVAAAKAAEERRLAVQQLQEEKKQAALQQAQSKAANTASNLEQAKTAIATANQAINVVWQATTEEIRAKLRPEQREWLKKRELECKVKSLQSGSSNPDEQETLIWNCQADMTRQRTDQLTQEVLQLSSLMSDPRIQNAKLALDQANAQLNVAWQSMVSPMRKQLLPEQRDWLHLRALRCEAQARNPAYNGPVDQEVARLNCETQLTP